MNFYSLVIFGYCLVALILIYLINRDRKNPAVFFGRKKWLSLIIIGCLIFGLIIAIDTRIVEPQIIKVKNINLPTENIKQPIKIILLTDLQVRENKNDTWVKKIVAKIEKENPDLVLIAGDLIDNEGSFEDESVYLEPLKKIVGQYPIYYILGNHEYGIGNSSRQRTQYRTGDHSYLVINRMAKLGITLLKNDLDCPEISTEKICIYGIDDIWGGRPNFENLKKYSDQTVPLIFLTHNPDGILLWPKENKKPNLVLSGHTHGGQINLPVFGPLGNAGLEMGKDYYYGLKKWADIPIYISSGLGESGGQIRFLMLPEIVVVTLSPSSN